MNEIAKEQKCIVMRGGMQHWVDVVTVARILALMNSGHKGLIEIASIGSFINPNDISGIYSPQAMEVHTRQKNGEWQCKRGTWHAKFTACECGRQVNTFKEPEVKRASQETINQVRETINQIKLKKLK